MKVRLAERIKNKHCIIIRHIESVLGLLLENSKIYLTKP